MLTLISRGGLRYALIRSDAGADWQPIASHAPFGEALRRQSPTIRLSRPPRRVISDRSIGYFTPGGGWVQKPLMHSKPMEAPQHSEVIVHFSNSCAHPGGLPPHTSLPAASGRQ